MELKEPLTDEESLHVVGLKNQIVTASDKTLRLMRRRIRYRLFRVREGKAEHDNGLRKIIEAQFTPDMTFDKFTFNWDVSPRDPLKVVTVFEWVEEGGTFESQNVMCEDGVVRPQKVCFPAAFTKQA